MENQVFSIVEKLLSDDNFFVSGKCSKVFQKKGYYSRDRGKNIIFDITIETFMPGAKEFSILTIIECKNLNHKVPVDDVEEFVSKIRQIGEDNTKGIIISQNGFQEGALNYAKSNRLGVCVVQQKENLCWISYRKNRNFKIDFSEFKSIILGNKSSETNFAALLDNKTFNNIPDLFIDLSIIDKYHQKSEYIKVRYLSDSEIEANVLKLSNERNFYNGSALDLNLLTKYLDDEYNLKIKSEKTSKDSFLGKVDYQNREIVINEELDNNITKKRFTIAHEIGHFILHRGYSDQINEISDKEIDVNILTSSNKRMEIQANLFACQLLMPLKKIIPLTETYFTEERIYKGYLYLDHQVRNQILVMNFLTILHKHFNVSKSVAKYRLKRVGLIRDITDNSIKGIINRDNT